MRKWISYVLIFCSLWGSVSMTVLAEDSLTAQPTGTIYNFKDLKVTEATLGTRYMPPSELGLSLGALLFRNSVGPGHHVTVAFEVAQADEYEIDLQAYRAVTYGIYEIKIDGESVGQYNFHAPTNGPGEFEALTTMFLTEGTHHITFECVGKDAASSSYFVSFMQLMLLNEEDREARYQQAMHIIYTARNELQTVSSKIPISDAVENQALRAQSVKLSGQLQGLEEQGVQSKENPSALRALKVEAERISLEIKRLNNFVEARKARPSSAFGLTTADTMSLVYPRDLPCRSCSTGPAELTLAQGEYESLQAVVMTYGETLRNLSAEITSIKGPEGDEVPESLFRASVNPLGSVYVKKTPVTLPALGDRPKDYEGWIPDPVRTDISRVDVAAWDMQPFWIELYTSNKVNPGTYRVTVQFSADGKVAEVLEIDAVVWPFAIPDRPDLATSISTKSVNPFAQAKFSERWYILEEIYNITDAEEFAKLEDKYIDLLETFKIEPDLINNTKPPTVEELLKIKHEWGLRQFNIIYLPPYSMNFDMNKPGTWQPQIDKILLTIETAMVEYEQAGLADKAYIYGFDESSQLGLAKEIFRQIKERFPDLPIMTTYLDRSLGVDTGLAELVDIWVPGVELINHDARIKAQNRGAKVYWYTHQAVRDPLPNWFNGYAPSDTRVLLGPMSHKMNVDGFLYYNIARWVNRGPMDDGILSNWDPRTYPTANGDGSLFYPGADGPLASQRMHNFRDGLEDYNLLNVLEASIERADEAGISDNLLTEAKVLLNADAVVTTERVYTKDASVYRKWREEVSQMIVQLMTAYIIERELEAYIATGNLKQPLASQLTNHLTQAIHHRKKGQDEQGLHSLALFVQHLNNEQHTDTVSEEAKARLDQDVRLLIAKWQKPAE